MAPHREDGYEAMELGTPMPLAPRRWMRVARWSVASALTVMSIWSLMHSKLSLHEEIQATNLHLEPKRFPPQRHGGGSQFGGDTDEHGCYIDAGYRWCQANFSCIRPWEHSFGTREAFSRYCSAAEDSAEMLGSVGGDRDDHGCIPSAGYRWCAAMSTCIRPWEQALSSMVAFQQRCGAAISDPVSFQCNCPPSEAIWNCTSEEYWAITNGTTCRFYSQDSKASAEMLGTVGGDRDDHGCIPSAGYRWCAAMSTCIRPWEQGLSSMEAFQQRCGTAISDAAIFQCNCPPSEAIWKCTSEEYQAITNGATCRFYSQDSKAVAEMLGQVGGDRDDHGCIPSAGYRWCAAMSTCIRPWEQALSSMAAFQQRCATAISDPVSFQCNCPPSEAIWKCTSEEYQAVTNGTTCRFYSQDSQASACSQCASDKLSTACRACYNNMSERNFCMSCINEGLNDIGCTRCKGVH